jgi:hypothetical protein
VPRQTDTPRQTDAPRQNDAPGYVVRPQPVETPAHSSSPSASQRPPVVARGDDQPSHQTTPRQGRDTQVRFRHQHARVTAGRIIAALHRYGIYW